MSLTLRTRPPTKPLLSLLVLFGLLSVGTPLGAGVSQAATTDVNFSVDFGSVIQRTDTAALGFGSSTYGATPLSSSAQNQAELRLDARAVRIPVGFRNGKVTTSAGGTSGSLDVPSLVQRYRSWGYRVLVVIGGRTNDTDIAPGDATQIIRALGVHPDIDYSAPNEPNNRGQSIQDQIATARMIVKEGQAIDPTFKIWGPVWTHVDRETMKTFAAGMGSDLGGIDFHHYAMGSTSSSTADALRDTPLYGQGITEVKQDLGSLGLNRPVNIDELNFSWRYQDGTPGGNNRFFTAVNTVWMTSALGHILKAGGRGMPYASQNGPLGIMVEEGNLNPDNRPASSPMPAYWGIAAWTGGHIWPHYKDAIYNTTSSDPLAEVFGVNNEAGGYNVIAINKSETDSKRVSLLLKNLPEGSYTTYQSNPAAPYDQPSKITESAYSSSAPSSLTLPRMSVTVVVVKPGAPTPPAPSSTAPNAPVNLVATDNADRSQANLTWQAPSSDGGSAVSGYRVSRDGTDSTGGGAYSTVVSATTGNFAFSLLKAEANYRFTVQAINAVGTSAAAVVTRAGSATAPPTPPTRTAPAAIQATRDAAGTRVNVSWQPPTSDGGTPVTNYRVTRNGTDSTGGGAYTTDLPATARNFVFSLLSANAGYQFTVQALHAGVAGPVGSVTSPPLVTKSLPTVPTSVTLRRDASGTKITTTWQPPTSDGGSPVTGYRITRDGADTNGAGAYGTTISASSRSFTMTLLKASSPYTISVRSVTAQGTGPGAGGTSQPN